MQNPWWARRESIEGDMKLRELGEAERRWIPALYREFPPEEDGIFTLRGPRQVGKTTLLKMIIRKLLLEARRPEPAVFFFPCDRIRDHEQMHALITEYLHYARPRASGRLFIFLDEISFVDDWPRAVKALADEGKLRSATLLLTGSNTLDLAASSERLPGRRGPWLRPDLELLPLCFREYAEMVEPDLAALPEREAPAHLPALDKLLADYLLTGGFPCVINDFLMKGYVPSYRYEVYLKWIEGDLHKAGKSEDVAYRLASNIVEGLCSPTSWYNLAKRSGVQSHTTVESYVGLLERMFVLRVVPYFRLHVPKPDFKKNKKMCFLDPFILHALRAKLDGMQDDAFRYSADLLRDGAWAGKIVEGVVGAHLSRRRGGLGYWRGDKGEVDFIATAPGANAYVEVKYRNRVAAPPFAPTVRSLDGKDLTVVTKRALWTKGRVRAVPASVFLAAEGGGSPPSLR